MASVKSIKRVKFSLNISILLAVFTSLFFTPFHAYAEGEIISPLPDFGSFVLSVTDGQANVLRGVYAADTLALPIVQQPTGYPGYVSTNNNEVTQFNMAAEVGNVGLLAHNYLAGSSFSMLVPGQEVNLIYGDGRVESFVVSQVMRYQALDPYSPYSEFRNLDTGITITAMELFGLVYRGDRHVTFQTCIEGNGNSSWGRLFVIAEPLQVVVSKNLSRLNDRIW